MFRVATALLLSLISGNIDAAQLLRIYIDADFSNHLESSRSIEQGILTALDLREVKQPAIEVVRKDHRGNSRRSLGNIRAFLNDPNALLIFSGIHSPPLLANRDFINENQALFMVPWAAAGPITRAAGQENWIFRLSIDDTKAGETLVDYAIHQAQVRKPLLVLENTGWGKSNYETMTQSLGDHQVADYDVEWFDWSLGDASATALIRRARDRRNDAILLVANAIEGAVIAKAAARSARQGKGFRVISHWGITGGSFHERVRHPDRTLLQLRFLQTRFSFLQPSLNEFQQSVLLRAQSIHPDINSAQDIHAPTGFAHAFDLTRIVLTALATVNTKLSAIKIRTELRDALESTSTPVQGLIKNYQAPFSPYQPSSPDAHEALSAKDYAIGRYGENDEIRLIEWQSPHFQ